MKIGYFVHRFPYLNVIKNYKYGGGEVVAYNLAISMAKRGHDIHVFTTSATYKDSVEKNGSIAVHRYGTLAQILQRGISPNLILEPLKHEVDIIHVHIGSSPLELIAALLYTKLKKKPLVATYHGDVIPSRKSIAYRSSVWIYNAVVRKVLDFADVIISPSEYYINESIFLGKYHDKVVSIPNGINLEDFDIPYSKEECREKLGLPIDKKIILFLSVLHPKKGLHILLKAMPGVLSKVPNAELVIAGDGIMRGELEKLSEKLGVKDYVNFTGFVPENLKPLYYKSADVFCLPSSMSTEVFPMVLLEASASGLPMVASDLNTFKCIIEDGYNGLFIKRGNEKDLVDAIVYLLRNEDLRKKMAENAREKVKNYSWGRIAEITEEVYKSLIKQ